MPPEKRERMQEFAAQLYKNISVTAAQIKSVADDAHARKLTKRDFVSELQPRKADLPFDVSLCGRSDAVLPLSTYRFFSQVLCGV
jgi:hypothetical protein